jgi:hypothetical protein
MRKNEPEDTGQVTPNDGWEMLLHLGLEVKAGGSLKNISARVRTILNQI